MRLIIGTGLWCASLAARAVRTCSVAKGRRAQRQGRTHVYSMVALVTPRMGTRPYMPQPRLRLVA